MLAATFISAGYHAVRHPERLTERAKPVTDQVGPMIKAVHPSLPNDPETLVRVNGAAQVVGGLLLATGTAPRPAAALLAGSLLPTTVAGHRYWEESDPAQRAHHRIHFFKNLSMLGGLLLAVLDTEGRPGLAWRAEHAAGHAAGTLRDAGDSVGRTVRRAGSSVAHGATEAVSHGAGQVGGALLGATRTSLDEARRTAERAGRTATLTKRETRRALKGVQRSAKTARREAKLAYRAAQLGRRLPG
jgi:uncharacterized membrane protein YphA (DoxX/SURF4 family)